MSVNVILEEGLVGKDPLPLFFLFPLHSTHQFVKRIVVLVLSFFLDALLSEFLLAFVNHFGEQFFLFFDFQLEKVFLGWHQHIISLEIFHLFVKLPPFAEGRWFLVGCLSRPQRLRGLDVTIREWTLVGLDENFVGIDHHFLAHEDRLLYTRFSARLLHPSSALCGRSLVQRGFVFFCLCRDILTESQFTFLRYLHGCGGVSRPE